MAQIDSSSLERAIEMCKTYKDGSIKPEDLPNVCRHFNLNHREVMDVIPTNGEGRYKINSLLQFVKQQQTVHAPPFNHHMYDQDPSYSRGSPPLHRPPSGTKMSRQGVVHSSSGPRQHGTRYPVSSPPVPLMVGAVPFVDSEDCTPEEQQMTIGKRRQEMIRSPENYIYTEDKTTTRMEHERAQRLHTPHSHLRHRTGNVHPRATIDSPPIHSSSYHPHSSTRRTFNDGRSDKARSHRGDESGDDEQTADSFYPPPSRAHGSKKCKQCERQMEAFNRQLSEIQEDLKVTRAERERLEKSNEKLRKQLHMAQNSDVAYGQLYHENEKLRHENEKLRQDIKRLRKAPNEMESDRTYFDWQQYEELKKAKEDLKEEYSRERSHHKACKKECAALKAEYNNIRLKNEELQQTNWRLKDDNHKLRVRMMDDETLLTRRPGDGGSEEAAIDLVFSRNNHHRQTYHFPKNEATTRGSHKSRLEMKRTSSEGKALDYDEPVKESARPGTHKYSKAKTYKSAGTSDVSSVGDHFVLSYTAPDEQTPVFRVLGQDVSKSVLPEGLPAEREMALICSLQNCHSIQELIKSLISYEVSLPSDNRLNGFQVENDHLKSREEHLKTKLTRMTMSFQNAKAEMTAMYHKAKEYEANNTRLRHTLKLCEQACDVYEILLEYKTIDSRHHSSGNSSYFHSLESLDTTTRSPDRDVPIVRNSLPARARVLLIQLEANPELQSYLPYSRHGGGRGIGDYHCHPGTYSQISNTTSGLSSMSGGTDIEITSNDLDRLRQYSQALRLYESHLVSTMVCVDGLEGIATVKKQEAISDSLSSDPSRGEVNDMEEAAHAEELCKVREEKAELKSQLYMMDQEKRRLELEVGRLKVQKQMSDRKVDELLQHVNEKRRKEKKRSKRKNDAMLASSHDLNHMSELSIEYNSALEREKELNERYENLFKFLQNHVKDSQEITDDLMRFVKELRQANSALVDAFEKSKKRQQAEKRRLKHELINYMNRFQGNGVEESANGPVSYS